MFDGGTAANGQYEMEFVLRDQSMGGNQIGVPVAIAPVIVTNGLFQVTVDFGTNVWDGAARWLDVSVRTNGSMSPPTLLTPSQLIQPVPYAIHSIKAGELVGTLPSTQLSGSYPNAVNLNNAANTFGGNGSGLTSLNASQLATGTVPDARLAAAVTRDAELLAVSNLLSARIDGNNSVALGAINTTSNGLSSRLDATNTVLVGLLNTGDSNVMFFVNLNSNLLNGNIGFVGSVLSAFTNQLQTGNNTFGGTNQFLGHTVLTNSVNVLGGDGSLLTGLNGSQITGGTVADTRIAATLARDSELLSASNSLNTQITAQNTALLGAITTTSNDLDARLVATNIALIGFLAATNSALMSQITTTSNALDTAIGNEAAARAALATMLQTGDNAFAGSNHFSGITLLTNSANVLAGDGSGLMSLNGSQITSGTVADARIDSALTRDSELLSVSNSLSAQIGSESATLAGAITTTSNGLSDRLVDTNTALVTLIGDSSNSLNTALMGKITTTSNSLQTAIDNEAAARGALATMLQSGDNAFAGSNHFSGVTLLTNTANVLAGDGSGLNNLNAGMLSSGTLPLGRLPAEVLVEVEGAVVTSASIDAASFTGSGSGLTALNASQLSSGTVADARLTANVARLDGTNVFSGTNRFVGEVLLTNAANIVAGTFAGDGVGITSLDAGNISSGTLSVGVLPTGVVIEDAQTGVTLMGGISAASFSGNGASLTSLNASQLASGTVPDARLDATITRDSEFLSASNSLSTDLVATNVALIGLINSSSNDLQTAIGNEAAARSALSTMLQTGDNTFAGSNHFSGIVTLTNADNELVGAFIGDGAGLTNVPVAVLTGTLGSGQFSGTYSQDVTLAGQNIHSGSNHFSGVATLTNAANTIVGNGSGLTALNAGSLSSGTLDDARLSGNVALTTNSVTFAGTVGGTALNIGVGHSFAGTGSSIAGGLGNSIDANATNSFVGAGTNNVIGSSGVFSFSHNSVIVGGTDNLITNSIYSVIVGGAGNSVPDDSHVGFIGGGMGNSFALGQYGVIVGGVSNMAGGEASYNFIGGGDHNTAWNSGSAVVGGRTNYAGGTDAFIGGGRKNTTGAGYSVVAGGRQNQATGQYAFVGGGYSNNVTGQYGAAAGGYSNTVSGAYGFAGGRRAQAVHSGAFVWADGTDADFASPAANTFNVRAQGGANFNLGTGNFELTTSGSFQHNGSAVITTAGGDGSALTNLSAANLASGTLAAARIGAGTITSDKLTGTLSPSGN